MPIGGYGLLIVEDDLEPPLAEMRKTPASRAAGKRKVAETTTHTPKNRAEPIERAHRDTSGQEQPGSALGWGTFSGPAVWTACMKS